MASWFLAGSVSRMPERRSLLSMGASSGMGFILLFSRFLAEEGCGIAAETSLSRIG